MERPSRLGLISLLIAVEVVIAGFALYTLRGTSNFVSAGGFHHVDYAAKPFAPVAAGLSPVVTIDEVDSKVVLSPSSDGMVHVTDDTVVHGFIFGSARAQVLTVNRTLDGVRVYRPEGHFTMGDSTNRIEVQVPPNARVTIARSGGDEISGLRNGIDVTSQDGRISLTDVTGNIKAHSDDGRIVASHLNANQLDFSTGDGRLELSDIEMTGVAPHGSFRTSDGPVMLGGLFPAGGSYTVTTGDGRVDLAFQQGSSATIDASTGDGRVYVDGSRYRGQPIVIGAGGSQMRVRSEDGSVHITSNGAQ